ncbi:hypothetical protein CK203_082902 [Vitis vinifera]|uniref:Uncharacterized protein n=1 Tax=Vitis vinifera TaxID=29760 RepID=A0A438D6W9_VITVI|nr:hypothetical protein CK203_082902 [Vitis vinifera]
MTETTEPVSAYPNGTGWAGGLGHGVTHRRYRISKHSPPLPVCSCNCNFWVVRSSFTQMNWFATGFGKLCYDGSLQAQC